MLNIYEYPFFWCPALTIKLHFMFFQVIRLVFIVEKQQQGKKDV